MEELMPTSSEARRLGFRNQHHYLDCSNPEFEHVLLTKIRKLVTG